MRRITRALPLTAACMGLVTLAACTNATTTGAPSSPQPSGLREASAVGGLFTHGIAVTWSNAGTFAYTMDDGMGRYVIRSGDERVSLSNSDSGVDGYGELSNDCWDWAMGKMAKSVGWEVYNPTIGYPRLTFQFTGDTSGYDVDESRDVRLVNTGMWVHVTRKPDWHYNDAWGWVKHFSAEVHASDQC